MSCEDSLRIVHLNTEAGFRGGEIQTLALADHLHAWGHRSMVLAPAESKLMGRARENGLPALPWNPLGELDPLAVFRLRRILREEGAEILHAHTAHALTLALLARGRRGPSRVVGSRRVSFELRSLFSRLKYRRADALIAVSDSVAEGLVRSGIPAGNVHTIHSGVDLERFRGLPDRGMARARLDLPKEGPVIGVVGALAGHKGHRLFLKALEAVRSEIGEISAVLAGEGEERDSLEEITRRDGLPVRFLGFLGETAGLYPALDLLVLPSLSGEGSPAVVKEAAACGIPVVATEVGGTSEILRSEKEALIVPPGDSAALAAAMVRLLTDGPLARRLAEAAALRATEFSTESTAKKTLALYRELLVGKVTSNK